MPIIADLFANNIFLSILLAGVIAQLAKILIITLKHKQKFHFKDLIITGGMPSTHSALVSSLTTIIWLNQGLSPLFFVVFTFSLIVLRDAMGVRRSVGEEGKIIEKIVKYENIKISKFHYSLGHTPMQVLVGLIIGFISAIFSYIVS
ncbi:MAG: divergent PAP2 family protein [Nanoarchaeota archaeon]|nr:divergent PAP2 family protein [Nanoarchaeota archaeon]